LQPEKFPRRSFVDQEPRGRRRAIRQSAGDDGDPRPFAEPPVFGIAPGRPHAGADFSSASSDFKALGAFFCPLVPFAALSLLRLLSRSRAPSAARRHTTSCGFAASEAISTSRPGFNLFKPLRCPFPGDSVSPSASRAVIPATETPRSKRSTNRLAISAGRAVQETNIERLRNLGEKLLSLWILLYNFN
jgi:hypothetical protein